MGLVEITYSKEMQNWQPGQLHFVGYCVKILAVLGKK